MKLDRMVGKDAHIPMICRETCGAYPQISWYYKSQLSRVDFLVRCFCYIIGWHMISLSQICISSF